MQSKHSTTKTVVFWIISALLGGFFIYGAIGKFSALEATAAGFAYLGLPAWFVPVVALTELAGGLLLLVPATRFYGAGLIAGTMVGATLTHLVTGIAVSTVGLTLGLLAVATIIAWTHRPDFVRHGVPQLAGN